MQKGPKRFYIWTCFFCHFSKREDLSDVVDALVKSWEPFQVCTLDLFFSYCLFIGFFVIFSQHIKFQAYTILPFCHFLVAHIRLSLLPSPSRFTILQQTTWFGEDTTALRYFSRTSNPIWTKAILIYWDLFWT